MERFKKMLWVVLLLVAYNVNAQDFDKAKMDSLFSIIEQNNKGMGSISLFQNGREVYQNSYGFASIEQNVAADADTKYRIGSVSKLFTAALIMKLAEGNALTLDTPLDKFYPQITHADKITIEDLLRHRSGIFNFTNSEEYSTYYTNPLSKEQLLQQIASYDAAFAPGEKAEYSNSNYVLLTFIAQDVSGKSYDELIEEYIARPCGLKNTFVGTPADIAKNEARSYTKRADWKLEEETDMSIPQGAGAIVSTTTELNVFINKLFAGEIVNHVSLQTMKTIKDGFGLGMFQVPFYEKRAYGHTGGIDGFQSNLFYFPEDTVSIAFLSNAISYPMNDILVGVLSIVFNRDYALPLFTEEMVLSSEELDPYLGEYASSQIPLKLNIFKEDNVLMAQGTGQEAFVLEVVEKDKFKYEPARLEIEFKPLEDKLILSQGGAVFEMQKE